MLKSGNRRRPVGLLLDLDEAERCQQIEIGRHRDRQANKAHQAERPERVLAEEVGDDIWNEIKHAPTMRTRSKKPDNHFIQILCNRRLGEPPVRAKS